MNRTKLTLSDELVEKINRLIPAAIADKVPKLLIGNYEGKKLFFVDHPPSKNDKTMHLLGYYPHSSGDLLLAIENAA